jgi:peptidoglycan hydrolase-like protein with peptidoglycan-binding domain
MSRTRAFVAPVRAASAMAGATFAGRGGLAGAARWVKIAALAAVAGSALAAGVAFAVSLSTPPHRKTALASAMHAARAASRPRAGLTAPLRVLSISPGDSADPVAAADPVRVVFSAALAPASPLPAFTTAVVGRWHADRGGTIVFTPAVPFGPASEVTLLIPAGSSGVRSATGAVLATSVTAVFQAGGWSTLRLERLLAQLGYLPLTWAPKDGSGFSAQAGSGAVDVSYAKRRSAAGTSAGGVFSWQGGYPAALTSQWQPGQSGVILTGALMAFQADHGLPMTGTATSGLWLALLNAAARGQHNPHGYTYALADKALPETLTVWHDGQVVMHGSANTGTIATPTADGTFPVYLRRRFQVMRGLMPDGAPYADPAQFISYFNGNYAVHSFDRASYGYPQSLGCVELPLSEARQVWPYLTYGSLVTVTG